MNLLISIGYINNLKISKGTKLNDKGEEEDNTWLTFLLWHTKNHCIYCGTTQLTMIDFITTNYQEGKCFVALEGILVDYVVIRDNRKTRRYINIVKDIEFLNNEPNNQFDLTTNREYRNWRVLYSDIVRSRNDIEIKDLNRENEEKEKANE